MTVGAPSCLEAGTLSTAAFTAGPEEGLELIEGRFGAEGCFVGRHSIQPSTQFYDYLVQDS